MSTPDLPLPDSSELATLTKLANAIFREGPSLGSLAAQAQQTLQAFTDFERFASPFAQPLDFDRLASLALTDPFDLAASAPTRAASQPRDAFVPRSVGAFELPLPRRAEVFDVEGIRRQFPILSERVEGQPLIWLDNAATTQKPQVVIDRLSHFYAHENSNIHRAAHTLAARSTDAYEASRQSVQRFLNARSPTEIVFTRGTTEAINLVAQGWGRRHLQAGDEILLTTLEHHSNIVPWQHIAAERGARIRVAPLDERGDLRVDVFERLLGDRTKIVALSQVSNALGTVLPVERLVAAAHAHGARVLVDGAQAVSHFAVDVQKIDCDFYVFSGHKVFGPTGIGALYGKTSALEELAPWQGGGNMITDVTFDRTTYAELPARLEAGTGNIADAVGLGAALDWFSAIGLDRVHQHEQSLLQYGTKLLNDVPGLRLIGTAPEKAGVLSFVLDGFRVDEVGKALAASGIAVRAGHHCAQPALRHFGLESTVRPSLALYNTHDELDTLAETLHRLTRSKAR